MPSLDLRSGEDVMVNYIEDISKTISPYLDKITSHPLLPSIKTLECLRFFTERHIYVVWDFMCLLKAIQCKLTTVTIPWFPPKSALGSHLVNSLLADEEGDIAIDGTYACHFQMYIDAMKEFGADTQRIENFLFFLKNGVNLNTAFNNVTVPTSAKAFVESTFEFIQADDHEVVSAFVYGRECMTPFLFKPLQKMLSDELSDATTKLQYYFNRHIQLDEIDHFGKGIELLKHLCQDDASKWQAVKQTAIKALKARCLFLDDVYQEMQATVNGHTHEICMI